VHLYWKGTDLGPLQGMPEAITPANVELTIQGRFYQFSGMHLESVNALYVGDSPKPVERFNSGLVADIGDPPPTDALLSFNIAGVKRPVVACVTRTKADTASADAPSKLSNPTQPTPQQPKADQTSVEVTTTTKIKTSEGSTVQSASGNSSTATQTKTPATAQTERVCGTIVVTAASPKAPSNAAQTVTAPSVMTLSLPSAVTQTVNQLQDSAKQIFLAPEPVRH
jgi:hypothetical protein